MVIHPYVIDFTINFIAGVAGLLLVLWIERQRRPRVSIQIGAKNHLDESETSPRPAATWLYVQICNSTMPKWLSWVYSGEPATSCQAWVSFHRTNGDNVFHREMLARWSETPEPTVAIIEISNEQSTNAFITAAPPAFLTPYRRTEGKEAFVRLQEVQTAVDIPTGECAKIDVVMRFKGEDVCYGWNNESYLHVWRHPSWVLGHDVYIASIRVKTGGRQFFDAFQIINDVPYDSFRLEPLDSKRKRQLAKKLKSGL